MYVYSCANSVPNGSIGAAVDGGGLLVAFALMTVLLVMIAQASHVTESGAGGRYSSDEDDGVTAG